MKRNTDAEKQRTENKKISEGKNGEKPKISKEINAEVKTETQKAAKPKSAQAPDPVIRNYKDTVFRMIYKDPGELLALYNAVNGTSYDNPDELEVTTLDNAVYMNMKNDVSCMLDMRMNLYEHQSTVNRNMPLRDLFYVARLYQKYTAEMDIYSGRRIMLPVPKFITFYNGTDNQPERKVMKLSDSYEQKDSEVNLELTVLQLNINPGYNEELKKNCLSLYHYMCYVEKVRTYSKYMPIEEAVEKAVNECIKEGILSEFFKRNKAEAIQMSIFEYDQELHEKTLHEEGYEEGYEDGEIRGMAKGEAIGEAKGMEKGEAIGEAKGIEGAVSILKKIGVPQQTILAEIQEQYHLSLEASKKYL